jgi:hypothetical protein
MVPLRESVRILASGPISKLVDGVLQPTCFCGKPLADAWHALSCPAVRRRAITTRHDKVLHEVASFARGAGVQTHVEPNDYDGCRPDAEMCFREGGVLVDVAISHPLAPSWLRDAARPLMVAERRARAKTAKYGHVAADEGKTFVPLVMESLGGMHVAFARFLGRIVGEATLLGGSTNLLHANMLARDVLRLRQRLSVTIQIWNAEAVAQWLKMLRNGGRMWP